MAYDDDKSPGDLIKSDDWDAFVLVIAANTAARTVNATNIATNVTDIATNISAIAANVIDIATNVTNIATNTSAIAVNTAVVSALSVELQSLTDAEIQQLQNIGATTISAAQWVILGGLAATLSAAEVNFLDGVTSAIQTQLNSKIEDGDSPTFATLTLSGALVGTMDIFADGDLTPSISGGVNFKTANSSAKIITDFDDGVNGQIVNIIAGDDYTTIASNANIKHNAGSDRVMNEFDCAKFIHNGTLWVGAGYEQNSV